MADSNEQHSPRRRPGRLFWIVGLAIGILGGAAVAIGIAEVTMVAESNSAAS